MHFCICTVGRGGGISDGGSHRVQIRVEMKQGECLTCPLSRSVHCNFVRDGNRLKGVGVHP
jgi:hypothetical protein